MRSTVAVVACAVLAVASPRAASAPAAGVGTMAGLAPAELLPDARFDPEVPTQFDVVGVEHGARPLRHDELLGYLHALAAASPRAQIVEYAHSHEGRPLVYLAVADRATIADLDAFRAGHARLADPRGRAAADDAALVADARAVAWVAYGIHGDELSSADAAAALAYWLVAGEDETARRIRSELVVLIDPCENPDGRERFLAQTLAFAHRTPNPDPEDLSHTTVWPWGRGNHYLFDLNRDWFTLVQPESRRSEVIAGWLPQLVVDSHEMGSDDTYLFPPSRHPFNPHLPAGHEPWIARFSADQARALDRRGWPYYTREWNEEFFPGYGSSWASYLGAIGILYEMSSTEGTLVRKRDGSVRTYPEAVHHQLTSSVANLTTLLDHRREILAAFLAHRRATVEAAGAGERPVAWLLPRGRRPERTDALVALLARQGIEVLVNTGPVEAAGLRDARTGAEVGQDALPERVYLVRLDQPAGALARALLDPHVPMESGFLHEEREWLERGRGTRLYETTAWSLPFARDVEAYWTRARPGGTWEPAVPPEPEPGQVVRADTPAVAWILDGASDRSTPALADLLQAGVAVRVAERPFRVAGAAFDRGAVLVRREGNPADLAATLERIARERGVRFRPTPTTRAEDGPDLGGSHFLPLVPPRVGVWTGWPVSPTAYGAVWHLLDERVGLRFNGLDVGRFGAIDLDRYNVLVFPPAFGGPGTYRAVLGADGVARLRTWIEAGGTAVGIAGGASFLADEETGLTATRLRSQALDRFPPVVLGPGPERAEAAGPFRAAGVAAPRADEEDEDKDDVDDEKKKKSDRRRSRAAATSPPEPASPYDVAPVLGPGARPFAAGHDQGTPASGEAVALADWLAPTLPPGKTKPDEDDLARADRRLRTFAPRGAFLRVELDPDSWLTWGAGPTIPALVRASDALVAEPPVGVAARFADLEHLHLGGLLWPEAAGRIARTAYATRERLGRGQVVLFLDEPGFRGWTPGTERLLVNALLYGPGLGTEWSAPW